MSKGRYGIHGGQYVPETLMHELNHLEECYEFYRNDPEFQQELRRLLHEYAGRPSLLYYAEKMTRDLGGARIYLKREDLNHTGSHKINNVLGQALLAKKMGKTRIIAETGAGQHGVATATAAALLDMECEIYMGEEDTVRQALNVYRMELLGGPTCHQRNQNLEGRCQCLYERVDKPGGRYPVCAGFRHGSPSVSHDGEGFSECDQPGSQAADSGTGGKAPGGCGGLCGRRQQFHGNVLQFYSG